MAASAAGDIAVHHDIWRGAMRPFKFREQRYLFYTFGDDSCRSGR